MSFAFNFLAEEVESESLIGEVEGGPGTAIPGRHDDRSEHVTHDLDSYDNSTFVWIQYMGPAMDFDEPDNEMICLDGTSASRLTVKDVTKSCTLRRVREDSFPTASSQQYQTTDLVPGVYEGGLKVWECSLDLCRYLQRHNVQVDGYVLELGCGHGLPGCWALKRALSRPDDETFNNFHIVFSDYNEFVLRDVTVVNVALNAMDAKTSTTNPEQLDSWVDDHVAFGAGDWNLLSEQLQCQMEGKSQRNSGTAPVAVPKSGHFDCILAAETTYSEKAAIETARFVSKHLTPGTGVAYIATKRYYFGVGGGTGCFCDALLHIQKTTDSRFHVETLEVFDDGASNIRELIRVKMIS